MFRCNDLPNAYILKLMDEGRVAFPHLLATLRSLGKVQPKIKEREAMHGSSPFSHMVGWRSIAPKLRDSRTKIILQKTSTPGPRIAAAGVGYIATPTAWSRAFLITE